MTTSVRSELYDRKAALLDRYDAINALAQSEKRPLSDEEMAQAADALAQAEKVQQNIDLEEKAATLAKAGGSTGTTISVGRDLELHKPWGFGVFGMSESEFVQQHPRYAHLAVTDPKHPVKQYREAAMGEFLQSVYRANTGQGIEPRLTYVSAAQGMGATVGPDGGFLLRATMQDDIKLRMSAGQIYSRITPTPLDDGSNSLEINVIDETSRATGSRHGGVRGYWVAEGDSITASKPKLRRYSLKVKGLAALGYATNELLRNARALGSVMTQAFGDELKFLTEDAVVNGNGAGMPTGLLTAGCLISQAKETGQAATTVETKNLSKMWSRLLPDLRSNAVWLIHSDVEPELDELAIAVGTGGIEPRFVRYNDAGVLTIKGRPVVAVEYCATLGTVGDIILANFDEYGMIEVPIEQASSMHVAFTTNEMAFRVMYYVDGEPYMRSTLTPFKGNTTQSSVVALATRS